MPRSDTERLELLKSQRDSIDDALVASAGNADVVEWEAGGKRVERNRLQAQQELREIEKQIQRLEVRVNGRAVNYSKIRRDI